MDYDYFYSEGMLRELEEYSLQVPPAIRDYSAGIVQHTQKMLYKNMFPKGVDSHFLQMFSEKGPVVMGQKQYMQDIRDYPLKSVPGFTNVQKNIDISSWSYQGRSVKSLYPADIWQGFIKGEQEFKALTKVGQLQDFVIRSTFGALMQLNADRYGADVLGNVGRMIEIQMQVAQPTYAPGVDVVKSTKRIDSPYLPHVLSTIDDALNKVTDPTRSADLLDKTTFKDIATNPVTTHFDEPFGARVKPVAGKENAYQLPGLKTPSGRLFSEKTGFKLETVSEVNPPGWKTLTITEADNPRLENLFAYTADQGQPKGLSFDVNKANVPNIRTLQQYLRDIPRGGSIEQGNIAATAEWSKEYLNELQRGRVYEHMPLKNPTGYYFDRGGNLSVWQTGRGEYPRRQLTLSPPQVGFLLGHQTAEQQAQHPSLLGTTPTALPKGVVPFKAGDPYMIQRQEADRLFKQQKAALTAFPKTSYESANILQWESETRSKEYEAAIDPDTPSMQYDTRDAEVDRASRQNYRYYPSQSGIIQTPNKAMQKAIAEGRIPYGGYLPSAYEPQRHTRGQDMPWEMPASISTITPVQQAVDPRYSQHFPGYGQSQVDIPERYGKPRGWRQRDIYGIGWRGHGQQQPTPHIGGPSQQMVMFPQTYDRQTGLVLPMNYEYYDDERSWDKSNRRFIADPTDPRARLPAEEIFRLRSQSKYGYADVEDRSKMTSTTFEAIQKGLRTATTRWDYDPSKGREHFDPQGNLITPRKQDLLKQLEYEADTEAKWLEKQGKGTWRQSQSMYKTSLLDPDRELQSVRSTQVNTDIRALRSGDIFSIESTEQGVLSARATTDAYRIYPQTPRGRGVWSQLEGWSEGQAEWLFKNKGPGWQVQYQPIGGEGLLFSPNRNLRLPTKFKDYPHIMGPADPGPRGSTEHEFAQSRISPEGHRLDDDYEYDPDKQLMVPAKMYEEAEADRQLIISSIRDRKRLDPVGTAMAAVSNRRETGGELRSWSKYLDKQQYDYYYEKTYSPLRRTTSPTGEVTLREGLSAKNYSPIFYGRDQETKKLFAAPYRLSKSMYSASWDFMKNARQPGLQEDPYYWEDKAYSPSSEPQQLRNPIEAKAFAVRPKIVSSSETMANTYSKWLIGQGVEPDVAAQRAHERISIDQRPNSFVARQLVPSDIPDDALTEEEAFAGTMTRGIAIGKYGYLRGDFMTQEELAAEYTGRELLQKSYLEETAAASHEIGHVVLSKLDKPMQKKFSVLFNSMLEKLGKEKMLAVDVPGKKFNYSEEFSSAYAIAATQGSDALKKYYPEYAKYFSDNWQEIQKAEEDVVLIRHKGDKNTVGFKARQLEVHGELPMSSRGAREWLRASQNPLEPYAPPAAQAGREYDPSTAYFRTAYSKGGIHGPSTSYGAASGFLKPQYAGGGLVIPPTPPATQLGSTATSWNAPQATYEIKEGLIGGYGRDELLDIARSSVSKDYKVTSAGVLNEQTGEVVKDAGDVKSAIDAGQASLTTALGQGALPSGQKEWAASLITRANKFIDNAYDAAYKQAMPGAEKAAVDQLRLIAKGEAKYRVIAQTGGARSWQEKAEITGMVYGAEKASIVTPEQLVQFKDTRIEAMVASGELTPAMTQGPARIISGSTGPVRIGGGGPGAQGQTGRLNLWGGKAGAIMYSSYIAKRMWNMTAGPEFQAVSEYGKYMGTFAGVQAIVDPGAELAGTPAGFESMQAETTRALQQGSFEQLGGLSYLSNLLATGGDGRNARLISAAKAAAAVGTVGAVLGQTAGFLASPMGAGIAKAIPGGTAFGKIGVAVASKAPWVAGAIAVAGIGLEVANLATKDVREGRQEPYSFGLWGKRLSQGYIYSHAAERVDPFSYFTTLFDRELVKSRMTPEELVKFEDEGEPAEVKRIRGLLLGVQAKTGEKVEDMQASVRVLARNIGTIPDDFVDIAEQWQEAGFTVNEATQAFVNLSNQFGYKPGTKEIGAFWDTYNATIETQGVRGADALMSRGKKVAQFGGQISQYYESPHRALQLTDRYDLTTASKMMPVQSMLATAAQGGIDADTIIGYNATVYSAESIKMVPSRTLEERAVRVEDLVAEVAARRGTLMTARVDQPIQAMLQGAGYDPIAAITAPMQMGFTLPMQAQAAQQWLQTANMYGQGYGGAAATTIQPITTISSFQASIIPSIADPAMRAGYGDVMGALAGGMGQNLTDAEAWQVATAAGGNLGMASALANQQIMGKQWAMTPPLDPLREAINKTFPPSLTGVVRGAMERVAGTEWGGLWEDPYQWATMNMAGQPMYATDFSSWLRTGAYWETTGGGAYGEGGGIIPPGTFSTATQFLDRGDPIGAATQFFAEAGVDISAEDAQIWGEQGMQARTEAFRAQVKDIRRRQTNLAGAGAAISARFLWGGGAWTGTPAEGSIWAMQDTMRSMGNVNQLQEFQYSRRMMQTQQGFAIRGEAIQGERMEIGQAYSRWQSGFQQQGAMIQRGWAREDLEYNAQMRDMSFGWQQEDYEEAIRTSTGRQRAQIVRKRDRSVTQFNLEGEQVERQEERQEQVWAREDERFAKTQEYQENMMELDEEQFSLQKEQRETIYEMEKEHFEESVDYYKERFLIETDLIAKQRDHQAAQIALAGAQAALQKEMTEAQEDYNEQIEAVTKNEELRMGYMKTTVELKPEQIFESFTNVVVEMNKMTEGESIALGNVFTNMDNVESAVINALNGLFGTIRGLDPDRLNAIANALMRIAQTEYDGEH